MTFNPKIHNRRSIRLKEYDYSSVGLYFITLCVEGRTHLFGNIESGEMKLNSFGKIVADEWEKSAQIRENITLGEYIIMPDHFHGVIEIKEQIIKDSSASPGEFKSPSHTIGAIIRGFKGAATKNIKSFLFTDTGELLFAPTEEELLFAPTEEELLFAPTEEELLFAPTEEELLFAPTEEELLFAPTEEELLFAPTEEEIKLLKKMNPNKSIWQRNYYERIIRNSRALDNITNYIKNNPQNWELKLSNSKMPFSKQK